MAILFVHTPYSLPECKECDMAATSSWPPVNHYPTPFGYPVERCQCRYCDPSVNSDPPWYAPENGAELWNPQTPHDAAESSPRYEPIYSKAAEPSPLYREPVYTPPPRMPDPAPPASPAPDARRSRHISDSQMYSDEEASLEDCDLISCSSAEMHQMELNEKMHPCLNRGRTCERIDCPLAKLPREWCRECLLGMNHAYHSGKTPALHPCLRVWKHCKYGSSCIFSSYPRDWCLYCLRHQKHQYCDGIRPQHLPSLPHDVADRVIDHEHQKRLLKQAQEDPKVAKPLLKTPAPVRKDIPTNNSKNKLPTNRRTRADGRTMA